MLLCYKRNKGYINGKRITKTNKKKDVIRQYRRCVERLRYMLHVKDEVFNKIKPFKSRGAV